MIRSLAFAALIVCPTLAHAQMQPGQWQITVNVTSFDMPNAPPQMAEAFKKPQVHSQCITAEQAKTGPLEMMKNKPGCKATRENVSGGKLDAVIVCDQPGGGTMTATITGNFSPTKFDMNAAIEMTGQQAMKMTTVTAAERVGECKLEVARPDRTPTCRAARVQAATAAVVPTERVPTASLICRAPRTSRSGSN